MAKRDDQYVGYKHPPRAHRFQPGQSGNPRGRPKGTKNLRTDLAEELAEKITVTEGGQQLHISKQRAMVKTMVAKALKGDMRAMGALITLINGLEQAQASEQRSQALSEEDRAVIDSFVRRMTEGHDGQGGNDS